MNLQPKLSSTQTLLLRIILLGIFLRLLHLLFVSRTAFPELHLYYTQSDMHTFWEWSKGILSGDILGRSPYHPYFDWMKKIAPLEQWYQWWGGKDVFQQSPLYAYCLAFMRAIFKDSVLWIFFCQLMLGALQPWISFHLARSFFDNRTALVAALLTALYGPFVFHQATVLRDWLPPLLEPLSLLLLINAKHQDRVKSLFTAGLILGIAVLAKERILLWAPVATAYVLLKYSSKWKNSLRASTVLILGLAAGLSPLIVRNVVVGAPPLALSNRAAEGFIEANAPDAFPVGFNVPPSMGEILRSSGGKPMQVIRETLKAYRGNWVRFVQLQWIKVRALFDPMEIPNNLNFGYGVEISLPLKFLLRYAFIVPLAITGFFLSLHHWRKLIPLYLYGVVIVLGLLLSSISARQRLVIVPVMILFASWTLVALFQLFRSKQIPKAAAATVCIIVITCMQQVAIALPELRERITYAVHPQEYLLSAQIYAANSDYPSAVQEIKRLRAKARNLGFDRFDKLVSVEQADYHLLYADDLLRQGKSALAKTEIEAARSIYVMHKVANNSAWKNLGMLYLRINDRKQAKMFLQMFLEREPRAKDADEIRRVLSNL